MALPIGGFMPIPLAMMIPFMATQSMVMGDAFGRAFQYGKRKISAMTNEEFNKTSMEQQASEMFASYKNIIPTLTQSIQDSQTLQEKIIREMLLILPRFATSEELFKPEPFTVGGEKTIQDLLRKIIDGQRTTTSTNLTGGPKFLAGAQAGTAWVDPFMQSMTNFWNSLATGVSTGSTQDPIHGPIQGPGTFNTPTNTFQNIQDMQQAGTLDQNINPRTYYPKAPTESQLRKQSITESGLSPLAFNAREKFKANIDAQVTIINGTTKQLAYSLKYGPTNSRAIRDKQKIISNKATQKRAVAKLSALRIKYREVYGVYY